MKSHKKTPFSAKHGPDAKPDILIKDEILKYSKESGLSCASAFEIAENLNVSPAEVGKTLDLMNFKLIQCQLGLFGYKKKKRIITPLPDADQKVKDTIQNAQEDSRLACESVFEIASRLNIPRMTVSGACEAMKIKIKPCQLGAF